ncbi:MAG: VCBS repeat-containing protein, partial [Deltaproteobacteria bacterium]|nr:VCBS repeat-containing protein [Deltaproteobacteria bacterium]
HKGWPKYIGVGGEQSIRFADLDGDNLKEVIIATSDGRILVFNHDGTEFTYQDRAVEMMAGPLAMAERHGLSARGNSLRPSFITPAVGDIDSDGIKEIITVGEGNVYCFKATGKPQEGFPVKLNKGFLHDIGEDNHIGPGTMASPVIYDLDGDGKKEIIVAGADQRVYAWHPNGLPVEGWPVYVRTGQVGARIIHPPCIADINGDGYPEIIVATNEVCSDKDRKAPVDKGILSKARDAASKEVPRELLPHALDFINSLIGKDCLVYAIHRDGTMHDNNPDGQGGYEVDDDAFVKGWPVKIRTLLPDLLPLIGPSSKPCAYDYDGDGADEVVASFVSSKTTIIGGDGSILEEMNSGPFGEDARGIRDKSLALNLFDGAAIGDITGDGIPEIAKSGLTFMGALNLVLTGQNFSYNHVIQVWDPHSGKYLKSFPRTTDDYSLYSEPAIADVSGDGIPEVISGSGLYLVHAFGADGMDKPGFPKLTGGWIMTTSAIEDIDNDGLNEIAAVTREGWVFIWDTLGEASNYPTWPTYAHDNFNTSNLSTDAIPPAAVTDYKWIDDSIEFLCPGDDGFNGRAREIRIYTYGCPIDASNIAYASLVKEVLPQEGGTTMRVDLDTRYDYIAIIAIDDAGNISQLPLSSATVTPEESDGSPWIYGEDDDHGLCFINIAGMD